MSYQSLLNIICSGIENKCNILIVLLTIILGSALSCTGSGSIIGGIEGSGIGLSVSANGNAAAGGLGVEESAIAGASSFAAVALKSSVVSGSLREELRAVSSLYKRK